MNDFDKFENFTHSEFACPCCGANNMHYSTVVAFDMARTKSGIPYIINSAFRCARHNQLVGGSPTSSHLKGWAGDVKAETSSERFIILRDLMLVGFNRFGIYETFIHADNDSDKPKEVTWYGK